MMLEKVESSTELAEIYKNFNLAEPCSDVEFTSALERVAQYLLFGTNWDSGIAIKKLDFISDIPLTCKGMECPYATKCPVLRNMKKSDIPNLIGTDCRAERIFGLENFSAIVKELGISPEHTNDIINATAIIRLQIMQRRIDWHLAIDGMQLDEVATVNQRTGQAYSKRVTHPLFKEYEKLGKQIAALQSQLQASRKDKANLAATVGKHADALKDLFMGKIKNVNVMDAQFEEIIENPEE